MTAQLSIFDQPPPTPPRAPARAVTTSDAQRLNGQCARILDLLRVRPQLNSTLAGIGLKYTSRISDLRAAGYTIRCERVADGLTKYYLIGEPKL